MYGDFSRGHEPDVKRGRRYRRVLPQMGRPLIDSDLAASVDALLGETRSSTRMLGGPAGSSDLGFLITPGRLLAVFAEAAERVTPTLGTPHVWVDYRYRYADRYPALYIGSEAVPAQVSIPPLQAHDPAGLPAAALWARVEIPVTITVNGAPVPLLPTSPDAPERTVFPIAGSLAPLEIGVPAGAEVWLFLLEQDQDAKDLPVLWIAPGTYTVDGLIARTPGGPFPYLPFPAASGFRYPDEVPVLRPGGGPIGIPPIPRPIPPIPRPIPPIPRPIPPIPLPIGAPMVAYLELWERAITGIEDAGIVEQALGPDGTATRAELVAQVKLAALDGVPPGADDAKMAAFVRDAFDQPEISGGELTIDVPVAVTSTDPCAVPEVSGYSGADNRLYRVEVHQGGDLTRVLLKWSRDNASELFSARVKDKNLVFDAGTALADGDLVEVLSSVVDLGDATAARVTATGFRPAERAVGQLVQLVVTSSESLTDEVSFRLADPENPLIDVTLDDRYGVIDAALLKVRRWHGLIRPAGNRGPFLIEDGITAELSATGNYRPLQWWQYEARFQAENANGPWRPEPHGPERRYAPLALLEYAGAADPLHLVSWLDERFHPPGSLLADDSEFDGRRVGSLSDTVQEALEELFERPPEIVDASCGEIIIRPENTDLQAVFDTIPEFGSARLCIHPGTWDLTSTVVVQRKGDLVIAGAGGATILRSQGIETLLQFEECRNVRLQDLEIAGRNAGLVQGDGLAGSLRAVSCQGLDLERVTVSCAGATSRCRSAVEVNSPGPAAGSPVVRLRDCWIEAGHAQVGVLLVNASAAVIEGCTINHLQNEFSLPKAVLSDPVVAGRVARLLIDDVRLGEWEEATDELLVGSPDVVVKATNAPDGRPRYIVHLTSWGSQFITFTTSLPEAQLDDGQWFQVFEDNPIPGNWSNRQAPDGFILSHLRKFRTGLTRAMFTPGPVDFPVLTGPTRGVLTTFGAQVAAQNNVTAGGQAVVVTGSGSSIDSGFPQPIVLPTDPRPDVRITGNRITNFVQGVHVATSKGQSRGVSYRVTVTDNRIYLSVPSLASEPHGIFVGGVYHCKIKGNSVDLRNPGPAQWASAQPIDAIAVHGTFGPSIWVMQNTAVGTRRSVVATATNHARSKTPGWQWIVAVNTHSTNGTVSTETVNW